MRVEFEGKTYPFIDTLSVAEAMVLYDKAHIGVGQILGELVKGNPYVTITVVYLLKRRDKEAVRWEDLLSADILQIKLLPDEDEEDHTSEGAPASDPTEKPAKGGKSRRQGTSST